jgi:hypothetical protein
LPLPKKFGLVSGPIPIGTLIDRALASAKETVIAEIHRPDSFPWRKVREFLMLLLSRRPVLTMPDGSLVALTFGNLSNDVTALQSNWKLELDGELVLGIVKGTSISLHDMYSMTGALLLDRSEENVEYIFRVVKHLLEKGRLAEVHDDHGMHLIATA